MRRGSRRRSTRCRPGSTRRSHASSWRRWASRSTRSPPSRPSTWPPGTRAPDPDGLAGRTPAHAGARPAAVSAVLEPERILRLEAARFVSLDQRLLPLEELDVACRSAAEVAEAIRTMVVRGAPAIGIAAAYGFALAAASGEDLDEADRVLRESRPTAVNLGWALDQMRGDPSPEHARAIHRDEVDR